MIGARIALFCGNRTLEALPMPCKTPPARFRPETPETRRTARVDVISICPTAFSHGLQEFRTRRCRLKIGEF
jgi:hypothetical protein